jgi:protein Tex
VISFSLGFFGKDGTVEISQRLAQESGLTIDQVRQTLALFDEGATVPFIARYRKEKTGNLDETQILELSHRYEFHKELDARKETILTTIRELGKLTPELETKIRETMDKTEIEDLYLPYKPKRTTRAIKAREAGLEPLARWLVALDDPAADLAAEAAKFLAPDKGVETADQALQGAGDILAEEWAEDAETRKWLRTLAAEEGFIVSAARKENAEKKTKFEMYYHFREKIGSLPSHRILALLRGEKEKVLKLEMEYPKEKAVRHLVYQVIRHPKSAAAPKLLETAVDSLDRLLAPAIETEIRKELRARAEAEAFTVFGENLRDLLLAAPAGRKSVIGLDPGFRTGCKAVAVDGTGKYLESCTIYPNEPRNDTDGSRLALYDLIQSHQAGLIAVGNGTAGRETEKFVRDALAELPEKHRPLCVVISESGASVYSASPAAKREFPKLDVTIRGAISIARRLQDPLAELVKIEPKSIGVGQYQHDVDQGRLKTALEEVVESCVNRVGVDLNLASEELLQYVSGLNKATAAAIVRRRNEQGAFRARAELKEVKGLGEKTFEQAAGFLRIPEAAHPLDNSAVHPERYALVENIAAGLGTTVQAMIGNTALIQSIDPAAFVSEEAGLPTLRDILQELEKPGRDPRAEFHYASFSTGVRELSDLAADMVLEGVVTNVANFGAFVDIGVHQDGLVHVSELNERFIKDPRQAVRVGQVVKVKILSVDMERRRIALSIKQAR